jgi:regulator of RNase E activity RraA
MAHTGDVLQEFILVTEHRSRPNDSSVPKRFLDSLLSLSLRTVKHAGRVGVGVQMRDMDEARYTRIPCNSRDACRTGNVHVFVRKVLRYTELER